MFWLIALVLFTIGFWNIHRYKTTLTHCRQVTAVLSELRYTPPMNGFHSKTYPVFKYSLDGVEYETEYHYQAINGSKITHSLEKEGLKEGRLKQCLSALGQQQPEFVIGQMYWLHVNPNQPREIYLAGQNVFAQEAKWFVLGFVLLIFDLIFFVIS